MGLEPQAGTGTIYWIGGFYSYNHCRTFTSVNPVVINLNQDHGLDVITY